jgi:hypothetical protein
VLFAAACASSSDDAAAKDAAAAVVDALDGAPLTLSRGRIVFLRFDRARADRKGRDRQIDLRFRARVEDDPT